MRRKTVITCVFALACILSHVAAPAAAEIRGKFSNILVGGFDIKEGVDFPSNYLATLSEELIAQLQEIKKFRQVVREERQSESLPGPAVRLIGTITEFKAGSRAKRYLIGFGAGKTKIKAHIQFVDHATGEVVLRQDVDGKVWIGTFGGESIGATRGLAKEVAKVARRKFF